MNKHIIHDTSSFLKSKINLLAIGFCGLSVCLWMLLTAKEFYYFYDIGGWDTAFFTQILRNLSHGAGLYSSLYGANFLADHCHYYAFLLAPFYWLWPDPLLLKYFQIGLFFWGAYIFFLILKKKLHPFIALGGMLTFTLAPANISMLRSCFNFEPFAIPLVFLAFKTFDEKKYVLFLVSCFFLLLIKEQMPLVVMMFGVLAFLIKKEDKIKWALVPLLMGLVMFIFDIFILTPYVRKDLLVSQSIYWARYSQYGKTPVIILLYLFTHPWAISERFFTPDTIKWYKDLGGTWGCLAFFSPQILLPALPLFIKFILSNEAWEKKVPVLYYASTFTPYIFLAAWNTLNKFENKNRLVIHSLALTLMLIHALTFIPAWVPLFKIPITTTAVIEQYFIDKIPADSSLIANIDYYRDWSDLYLLPSYISGNYRCLKKFILPGSVEYLLINLSSIKKNKKAASKLFTSQNFYSRWRLDESIENWVLYVKNTSKEPPAKLIDISKKDFLKEYTRIIGIENTIGFEKISFPQMFPQKYRILPVTLYWKCLNRTNSPYQIKFTITTPNGRSFYTRQRPIGSTIYPTNFWRKGDYVKESYFYLLPHMPQGKFLIKIAVYNPVNKKLEGPFIKDITIKNCDAVKQTPP